MSYPSIETNMDLLKQHVFMISVIDDFSVRDLFDEIREIQPELDLNASKVMAIALASDFVLRDYWYIVDVPLSEEANLLIEEKLAYVIGSILDIQNPLDLLPGDIANFMVTRKGFMIAQSAGYLDVKGGMELTYKGIEEKKQTEQQIRVLKERNGNKGLVFSEWKK